MAAVLMKKEKKEEEEEEEEEYNNNNNNNNKFVVSRIAHVKFTYSEIHRVCVYMLVASPRFSK